jgi:hypothetical protein
VLTVRKRSPAAGTPICQQLTQHEDPARYSQFGVRVTMNSEMLREVSGQLFHPTFRAAAAADEIILRAERCGLKDLIEAPLIPC